jgi:HD superfamily phosphohydrolase
MHLAKMVFDVVTDEANIHPSVEGVLPDRAHLPYWRSVVALAALAHDTGHLPFSHAAEKQLLPDGENHESITVDIIASSEMAPLWEMGQRVHSVDVQKLAVGQKKLKKVPFSTWESLLSEIIVGDSFGVDRMDYLLRDSYHCGVEYGKFDHEKLIASLRILPESLEDEESMEPRLGVELNGLHSAEALLLSRYFMYEQVYFHPVRRIYDIHLIDFMLTHYGANGYLSDLDFHFSQTDNEVSAAIRASAREVHSKGHLAAKAIVARGHFRLVYAYNPSDQAILSTAIESGRIQPELDRPFNSPAYQLWKLLVAEFGEANVKKDLYIQDSSPALFPVLMRDGRIEPSMALSPILASFPLMTVDSIYAEPSIASKVSKWIHLNREEILKGDRK